jgi:LuxR family maltose regulon positive regulatory protein
LWLAGELHAHLGQIYAEWNELDRALQQIRQGIELSLRAENHLALIEGDLALAGVRAAGGQAEAAGLALDQAQVLAATAGVPYLEAQVAARRAWLGLAYGSAPGAEVRQWAEAWAVRRALETEDLPPVLHEFQDLVLARFRLGQGQLDGAQELLDEIEPPAREAGRMGSVLQILLLRARLQAQQGERGRARQTLGQALALAEPEGYVRTIVDLSRPLRPLLVDLRTELAALPGAPGPLVTYADRLLATLVAPDLAAAHAPSLLTPRELEILALMAAGASNQEIAQRLVVTEGTVKGHVNHILQKLEAHNRTAAVARARALGLLER